MNYICPNCGAENDMNWPLEIDGKILDGGCQDCWEAQCSEAWWQALPDMIAVDMVMHPELFVGMEIER